MKLDYKGFFSSSTEVRALMNGLSDTGGPVLLYGSDSAVYKWVASAVSEMYRRDVLLYFEDDLKARQAAAELGDSVYYIPVKEHVHRSVLAHSKQSEAQSTEALIALQGKRLAPAVVVTSIRNAAESFGTFASGFTLNEGLFYGLDTLVGELVGLGYERVDYLEQKGEFSVRGGIVDVYSPMHALPVRIEFFGDEVMSMRFFDLETQESIERVKEVELHPAALSGEQPLEDCLKRSIVFVCGSNATIARLRSVEQELAKRHAEEILKDDVLTERGRALLESQKAKRYTAEEVIARLKTRELVLTEMVLKTINDFQPKQLIKLNASDVAGGAEALVTEMRRMQYSGYKICVVFQSEEKRERFVRLLKEMEYDAPYAIVDAPHVELASHATEVVGGQAPEGTSGGAVPTTTVTFAATSTPSAAALSAAPTTRDTEIKTGQMLLMLGGAEKGMIFQTFKSALITEREIFGEVKRAAKIKRPGSKTPGQPIKAISELEVGDYIVHDMHGIGRFTRIEQIVVENKRRDYLRIEYAGEDVLFVPVESATSIRKYIGVEAEKVKVSKLGGVTWKNQVARAKKHVEEIADELVELYAKRQSQIGHAFSADTPWQREFEDLFPYEETADQLRAVEEIKRDMESTIPMDRLLCGDVGYGKTEVALRAAFKAVADSKQVAVLVPTTILAQQHFNNFKERFSKYPIRVEMVSRFRTPKQVKEILKMLASGEVDVIIGTHRLLSKDVKFKDLGLLVVDEEQRFGVKHKESIKLMKEKVDVLTLTATPIPRTLHMSILGVRDMSVLEEPPEERSPVQTYVMEYDDDTVKEAILNEVERRGQVYYVYNRIDDIERVAASIQEMLPDVSVRFAHGKMDEHELERIMLEFMNGEFDVLVSTTIIETGLDIANVNTMIIRNADALGLSQLYQLRGRVGRSRRRAYCYVFFKQNKVLNEVQERRLRAIREFTDFGSGFKIAMKDLEIRGAGNMLGTAQSGFMEAVGYDLFARMLDESLRRRKGEEVRHVGEARIELKVNAYVPETYVAVSQMRIDMYKQIAALSGEEAEYNALYESYVDRFGPVPEELDNLLHLAQIKAICEKMDISTISEKGDAYVLKYAENAELDTRALSEMLAEMSEINFYAAGAVPELRIMNIGREEGWLVRLVKVVEKIYSYFIS